MSLTIHEAMHSPHTSLSRPLLDHPFSAASRGVKDEEEKDGRVKVSRRAAREAGENGRKVAGLRGGAGTLDQRGCRHQREVSAIIRGFLLTVDARIWTSCETSRWRWPSFLLRAASRRPPAAFVWRWLPSEEGMDLMLSRARGPSRPRRRKSELRQDEGMERTGRAHLRLKLLVDFKKFRKDVLDVSLDL